jgi:Spy/CpxP family protein refolding chaperone
MIKRLVSLCVLSLFIAPMMIAQSANTAANPRRAALEQQFRAQSAKLAQERLGLTDAQLAQLEQTNARFSPQMNDLVSQERDTRRQLRVEMTRGNQANQQHVSDLLDKSIQLQKQRIALVETEQKDLARFLTPTQRAGYIALQAQFRMRAQELTRQNGGQRNGLGGKGGGAAIKHRP